MPTASHFSPRTRANPRITTLVRALTRMMVLASVTRKGHGCWVCILVTGFTEAALRPTRGQKRDRMSNVKSSGKFRSQQHSTTHLAFYWCRPSR